MICFDPLWLIQDDPDKGENREPQDFKSGNRWAITTSLPGDEAEAGDDEPCNHRGNDGPGRSQKRNRLLGGHVAVPDLRGGRGRHNPASITIATSIAPTHIRQISRANDFMLPAWSSTRSKSMPRNSSATRLSLSMAGRSSASARLTARIFLSAA